jgi:DNA-binding FadR family transcriptional regulator
MLLLQSDSSATQHFITFSAASVRASQKRVLLSFRARIEQEMAAFAAQGITTKVAKKRKAAATKEEKSNSKDKDDKNKKAKSKK